MPATGVAADRIIAALVAQPAQLLEHPDQGQAFSCRSRVEGIESTIPGYAPNLPLVGYASAPAFHPESPCAIQQPGTMGGVSAREFRPFSNFQERILSSGHDNIIRPYHEEQPPRGICAYRRPFSLQGEAAVHPRPAARTAAQIC